MRASRLEQPFTFISSPQGEPGESGPPGIGGEPGKKVSNQTTRDEFLYCVVHDTDGWTGVAGRVLEESEARRERRDNLEHLDQLEDGDDPETTDPKETLYDADTQQLF